MESPEGAGSWPLDGGPAFVEARIPQNKTLRTERVFERSKWRLALPLTALEDSLRARLGFSNL
jgi:hypothetical protein